MTITVGDKAPDFRLQASNGEEVSLTDFIGEKHIVLYFYPRDMTPGCTTQACDFLDYDKGFSELDAVILGVSADTMEKHEKFIDKHWLTFLLLVDDKQVLSEKFGVWKLKKMFGKEFMGIERSTFIINKEGVV